MFRLCMKKDSRCWLGEEKKRKRKREPSSGEDNIWHGRSLFPRHVFSGFLFVSEGIRRAVGELSEGNTDINLPQHTGGIEASQSSALRTWSVISQELRDAVLEMQCPLHYTCMGNS